MKNTQNNMSRMGQHYLVTEDELATMARSAKLRKGTRGLRHFSGAAFLTGLLLTIITSPKGSVNYIAIWTALMGLLFIIGLVYGWRAKRALSRIINAVESRGMEDGKCQD